MTMNTVLNSDDLLIPIGHRRMCMLPPPCQMKTGIGFLTCFLTTPRHVLVDLADTLARFSRRFYGSWRIVRSGITCLNTTLLSRRAISNGCSGAGPVSCPKRLPCLA